MTHEASAGKNRHHIARMRELSEWLHLLEKAATSKEDFKLLAE